MAFVKGAVPLGAGGMLMVRSGRTPVRRLHVDALLKKCNLRSRGTPGTRELQYISTISRNGRWLGNDSCWERSFLMPSTISIPTHNSFPNGKAGMGTTLLPYTRARPDVWKGLASSYLPPAWVVRAGTQCFPP